MKVEDLESTQRARATTPAAMAPTRARLAPVVDAPLVLLVVEPEGAGLVFVVAGGELAAGLPVVALAPVAAEPVALPVRVGRGPLRVTPYTIINGLIVVRKYERTTARHI